MAINRVQHSPHAIQNSNWPPKQVSPRMMRFERRVYSLGQFLFKHWATLLTIALGLLVFAALSVPFLSYFGLDSISKPIFYSLHLVCAQIPSHSFYLFGHQLGMCARNLSIYASMFLGSLIFVSSKNRLKGIPWWVWMLMILPIAVDGTTQMFGLRESTWELRALTGTLFGLGNVWFVLPMMQKSLNETPMTPPRHQLMPQPPQAAQGQTAYDPTPNRSDAL